MTDFSKLVLIPDFDAINIGLSPAQQATMLSIFQRPDPALTLPFAKHNIREQISKKTMSIVPQDIGTPDR